MNGYIQTRCPRCGNAAWGHHQQAVPCNTCGQPVPPMASPQAAGWGQAPGLGGFGAAPGLNPQAQPAPYGQMPPQHTPAPQPVTPQPAAQPGAQASIPLPFGNFKIPFNVGAAGGGVSKLKVIGGVVLAIVLAIGGVFVKMKMGSTAKGNLSYASLALDMKKADPDQLISATAGPAKKWKDDAVWWSINLQWVKADGTVDLSKGGAVVEYISLGGVQSLAKNVRKDSVKKYNFGPAGVDHKALWGATEPWTGVEAPPAPTCSIKDVVKILNGQGLTGSKTVRITFDPKFADYYAWHVIGQDPKIDAHYSFQDCSPIK